MREYLGLFLLIASGSASADSCPLNLTTSSSGNGYILNCEPRQPCPSRLNETNPFMGATSNNGIITCQYRQADRSKGPFTIVSKDRFPNLIGSYWSNGNPSQCAADNVSVCQFSK